jgi:predicted secreted protein
MAYDEVIGEAICERIGNGEPLRVICRDAGMPAWRTVYDWIEAHPEFAARIARARARGFDAIAEECLDIADHTANDTKVVHTEDGSREMANTEWISRSKLRVETRLKLLAKWDPKRYGEKLQTEHAGELTVKKTAAEYSDAELAAIIAGKKP